MKKIDITLGTNSGDSGPEGGGKINDNFKEVVKILFGEDIWQNNVTQDLAEKLLNFSTNNKTSFLAAINEVFAKTTVVVNEVNIQGALVLTEGKTDLSNFEDNDRFRYQTTTRYCVGVIIDSTSITLPADLDNKNKIKLAVNSRI